jgi:hypothetical protein
MIGERHPRTSFFDEYYSVSGGFIERKGYKSTDNGEPNINLNDVQPPVPKQLSTLARSFVPQESTQSEVRLD